MAIHVEILAAKLSQHYYLDALAVTALLLLMTAGFLVPKGSLLDQWTGLAHSEQPLLLCLAVAWDFVGVEWIQLEIHDDWGIFLFCFH